MSLFAIGDLHFSFSSGKPMDVFGAGWHNHHIKIKNNWLNTVSAKDTVIITGDTSWGLKLKDALPDLAFLEELPGRKIIIKGNHDYWWDTLKKNSAAHPGLNFLHNNYYEVEGGYAVCGARGWILDSKDDITVYNRELGRLSRSIKAAEKDGFKKVICALHFPPDDRFMDVMRDAKYIVYGHMHGVSDEEEINSRIKEAKGRCMLTACDYLNFKPRMIMD
jgi:hypothetical protein